MKGSKNCELKKKMDFTRCGKTNYQTICCYHCEDHINCKTPQCPLDGNEVRWDCLKVARLVRRGRKLIKEAKGRK